ncbi:MAG: hypothetical protein KF876_17180 [Nitrospira sp.]|jgi:hypothetical protein|nr:hypothetical protein [Nitrospira sp.]
MKTSSTLILTGGLMKRSSRLCALLVLGAALMTGCTSVGNLGIVTKPSANNADRLKSGVSFEELGPVEGSGCRHFILAIIPFGDSSFSKAVDEALSQKGGDALINVTVSSSLYGFIPIYNVYSFTCTSVSGIAVKYK